MLNESPIRDINVVDRIEWGNNCFEWPLMEDKELTVVQVRMPPNTEDILHYHEITTSFVYILSGSLQIEINGIIFTLNSSQGLKIPRNVPHKVLNVSNTAVDYLVVTTPGTLDDRVAINS